MMQEKEIWLGLIEHLEKVSDNLVWLAWCLPTRMRNCYINFVLTGVGPIEEVAQFLQQDLEEQNTNT